CYRSENSITGVVDEIIKTYGADAFEVILVNDCSPDNTLAVLKEICTKYSNVRMLSFAKNFGQHSALMAGLRESTGDIVICLDDDGQTPPGESVKLVAKINEGFDVVYARYEEKQHSAFRNLGSRMNNRMSEIMLGKPRDLYMSSFVAMKRFVVDEILRYDNPYPYLGGLVLRITSSITDVPVLHKKRTEGTSGYSLGKLISLWMNGFTSFSIKPLRIATVLGLIFALAGFIAGIVLVVEKIIYGDKIALGWTSNMAAILFIGGLVLLVLGLVGEYMGRTFISMNKQPQYVIKEKMNSKDK
ncbi:MAG: glycosyltransferase family 2 protein, partial [Eubacteriales bacterium]